MGCVSSKHIKKEREREKDRERELIFNYVYEDSNNQMELSQCQKNEHVVSLTSSTYGALNLEKKESPVKDSIGASDAKKKVEDSPPAKKQEPEVEVVDTEVINTWELMEDLEEVQGPVLGVSKRSPKGRVLGEVRTPLKNITQFWSPRSGRKLSGGGGGGGKENRGSLTGLKGVMSTKSDFTPRRVLKPHNSVDNSCKDALNFRVLKLGTPVSGKRDSFGTDRNGVSSRRSLGPLFDPELVASFEKELNQLGKEQVKKMISPSPKLKNSKRSKLSESILSKFEKKCPPGGENAVVIYTTTLRGIRKTFEECNAARDVIESYQIRVLERDVSMDSGFKEELRKLLGTKEVKVPVVFVKGRMIGGANEVLKLDEEGKLGLLFDGIERVCLVGCEICGGMRFVMCGECNGSCKVLDEKQNKVVKCGGCNENGLIYCPICC